MRSLRWLLFACTVACLTGFGIFSCGGEPVVSGNVILVVVDALRADHLGIYGYERPTSPEVDEWARGGLIFEQAFTPAPWTLPAFGSILTGRLPSGHGAGIEVVERLDSVRTEVAAARRFVTLGPHIETVAEVLGTHGFETGAYVQNPFLEPRFGLDRGFDDYDHYVTSNTDLRRADVVVDEALDWIDSRSGRPFYLLVHIFDPHLDYDAQPPFRGRFAHEAGTLRLPVEGLWPIRNRAAEISDEERDFIVAAYDEEVAFVDAQVGRLLAGLEERELFDSSLVALTSDHGEELFDQGGFEHGHSMHGSVLRVPLILWGRGVQPGREVRPVSLIDLAPTVFDFLGLNPDIVLPGRSLLRTSADPSAGGMSRAIVSEVPLYGADRKALLSWPYKIILDVESGTAQLFDVMVDPGEEVDLAPSEPQKVRELLGTLAGLLAEAKQGGVSMEADLDEDTLRRLRALGYIQ